MPSPALDQWNSESTQRIEQYFELRERAGLARAGRNWYVDEYNRMAVPKICSEFQLYARSVWTFAASCVASSATSDPKLHSIVTVALSRNLPLDRQNAQPSSLSEQFKLLGIDLLAALKESDRHNSNRLWTLDVANGLRNAVVHHDPSAIAFHECWLKLGPPTTREDVQKAERESAMPRRNALTFTEVSDILSKFTNLARSIDKVTGAYLAQVCGSDPWPI